MEVLFVTGFSPIVSDRDASRELYLDGLQLPLDHEEGDEQRNDSDGPAVIP